MTDTMHRPNNHTSPPSSHPRGGRIDHHALPPPPSSRGGRGGPHRAPFSDYKPNFDRARTALVVEQIPEENFSEDQVRDFFSQFGAIAEVTMQAYKRLAIVKFEDFGAAKTAYHSPKSVFENRFVKIYWFNPDNFPAASAAAGRNGHRANSSGMVKKEGDRDGEEDDRMQIDTEEFRKQQEEIQRQQEGKRKKLAEAEAAKQELDARVKAQQEERRKLLERLAAKTAGKSSSSPSASAVGAAENGDGSGEADTTPMSEEKKKASEALRKKLAELEEEAQTMGIDPDDNEPSYYSHPRGRGYAGGRGYSSSYRGRGGYIPRGRGYDPYYSPRGRGGGRGHAYPYPYTYPTRGRGGAAGAGAVKRLDNRSRTIEVRNIKPGTKEDEELRTWLFQNSEFEDVEAGREGRGVVVTFKQRYMAEEFVGRAPTVGGVGRMELGWVDNRAGEKVEDARGSGGGDEGGEDGDAEDVKMEDGGEVGDGVQSATNGARKERIDPRDREERDVDYVADEDRWMAG